MGSLAELLNLEPMAVPQEAYYAPVLQGLGKQLSGEQIPFRGVDLSGGERFLLEAGKGLGGTISSVLGNQMAAQAQAQMSAQMQDRKIKELLLTRALEEQDLARKQDFELQKEALSQGYLRPVLDQETGRVSLSEALGGEGAFSPKDMKELELTRQKAQIKADVKQEGANLGYDSGINLIKNSYSKAKEFDSLASQFPGWAGGESREFGATKEQIRQTVIGLLPDKRMNVLEQKNLDNLLPETTDTKKELDYKQDRLIEWIGSKKPGHSLEDDSTMVAPSPAPAPTSVPRQLQHLLKIPGAKITRID